MLFSIAIDGPSGAGKSTVARAIAQRAGALYLDTGAMYRAVGLYMLRCGVHPRDTQRVAQLASQAHVRIDYDAQGAQRIYLDDEDVSEAIRTPEASDAASAVSAVPEVRAQLVAMQRDIAAGRNVVMDGRDIGTCVLPNATLKIFLVADSRVRAQRRHRELLERGDSSSFEEVLAAIERRDRDDSTRAVSPLRKADGAVEIDASTLTVDQVVAQILRLLALRTGGVDL